MTITDGAKIQIKNLIEQRNKPTAGVRIGVRSKGCSGLSYTLEYADSIDSKDQTITEDGITVVIDPKAILFLIGSTMDFVTDNFKSGFSFTNPNEKGRCGCGESFHV